MDTWDPKALRWQREPYVGKQLRLQHPDHLAAVAVLHGLEAAPAERCRVLELGCGDGWNLVPMAEALPNSEFVGIDLDADRLALGEKARAALGLRNLTLQAADIRELGTAWGRFDYVIAHGLYSVVGDSVREVFFERVASLLGERGVAFVSANVYPGWRTLEPGRDLARFHAHHTDAKDGEPLVKRLRTITRFFAEHMPRETPDTALVAEQYRKLSGLSDYLIGFDQLGESQASYFEPLVRRAERAELEYVTDAAMLSGQFARLAERLQRAIAELSADRIDREQYADFCALPTFRQLVFTRSGRGLRAPNPESLRSLFFVGRFRATGGAELPARGRTTFEFGTLTFELEEPAAKIALNELSSVFPHALGFEELERRVRERLGDDAVRGLAAPLLDLVLAGPLTARARGITAAATVPERPRISEASRLQLATFQRATTALHTFASITSPFERAALSACDGRRTVTDIASELVRQVKAGSLATSDFPPGFEADLERAVEERLKKTLADAARHLLLLPSV
jgi:SAM-dependent methyltransferase/methyltransferase-like protein